MQDQGISQMNRVMFLSPAFRRVAPAHLTRTGNEELNGCSQCCSHTHYKRVAPALLTRTGNEELNGVLQCFSYTHYRHCIQHPTLSLAVVVDELVLHRVGAMVRVTREIADAALKLKTLLLDWAWTSMRRSRYRGRCQISRRRGTSTIAG